MKKHNVKLATAFVAMYFLIFLFGVMMGGLYAQVGINSTGAAPNSSAACWILIGLVKAYSYHV